MASRISQGGSHGSPSSCPAGSESGSPWWMVSRLGLPGEERAMDPGEGPPKPAGHLQVEGLGVGG